jgi:error-prone DNA polymerase
VASSVIVRQRPGKAKGIVFVSLEDETGIAKAVVMPDTFRTFREQDVPRNPGDRTVPAG